eukprot:1380288-Heterocapsa_arctica.AAC.1
MQWSQAEPLSELEGSTGRPGARWTTPRGKERPGAAGRAEATGRMERPTGRTEQLGSRKGM